MSTPETYTAVASTITFAVCGCCATHSDRALEPTIVTCMTCGTPCSCYGCVAEAEESA